MRRVGGSGHRTQGRGKAPNYPETLQILSASSWGIDQERLVNGYTKCGDQPVRLRGHTDDGDHLGIFGFGHALGPRAGGVLMNAIVAAMGN